METRLTKENFLFGRPKLFLDNFSPLWRPVGRGKKDAVKGQQSEEFIERIRLENESAVNKLAS